jgi:hypothetical protein
MSRVGGNPSEIQVPRPFPNANFQMPVKGQPCNRPGNSSLNPLKGKPYYSVHKFAVFSVVQPLFM